MDGCGGGGGGLGGGGEGEGGGLGGGDGLGGGGGGSGTVLISQVVRARRLFKSHSPSRGNPQSCPCGAVALTAPRYWVAQCSRSCRVTSSSGRALGRQAQHAPAQPCGQHPDEK